MKLIICVCLLSCLTSLKLYAEKFEVGNVVIDYQITGKGEPLFILHGGFGSKEDMRPQIELLKNNFEVVAVDSREHGLSTSGKKPISYELMYKDTLALTKKMGFKKINILGYSDGAIIGLMMASRHPDLVNKMVVIGANYHWNAIKEKHRKEFSKYRAKDMPAAMKDNYLKHDKELKGFENYFNEMMSMFLTSPNMTTDDIGKIKAEVLIVAGDQEMINISHTISMFHSIKKSQLFVIPGVGHRFQKKLKLVNGVIGDFMLPKQANTGE